MSRAFASRPQAKVAALKSPSVLVGSGHGGSSAIATRHSRRKVALNGGARAMRVPLRGMLFSSAAMSSIGTNGVMLVAGTKESSMCSRHTGRIGHSNAGGLASENGPLSLGVAAPQGPECTHILCLVCVGAGNCRTTRQKFAEAGWATPQGCSDPLLSASRKTTGVCIWPKGIGRNEARTAKPV
jgi:hypothetical protein